MPDDLSPAETSTLDALDAYLAELHAGRRPDRARWLAEHPELAPQLDCLDRLEALAPASTLDWTPDDVTGPPDITGELVADGRYELLGEVGRGGMGVVYRAKQVGLERVVALKMILAGSMASEDQLRRFQDEAKVAARVHHPHVVQVFETGQVNGLPYMVMQYVEGCSLAERLRAGPMPVEEAVRTVAAISRAVADLHAHGIVHRDLKPSNILLDGDGRPFVTDFGLAKLVESDSGVTQSGMILGTPQYMAPEQALGHGKDAGPAADVYSLGAILYECLTGQPPFRAETPLDTLLAVLESEPEPPRRLAPKVPRVLERVTLQCLDKQPVRRYLSAAALAGALDNFLLGEVVPTRRAGLVERLRRWARREPALVSRVVALVLFSGIVQANYLRIPDLRPLSLYVQLLLLAWVAVSWLCQQGLRWPGWADWAAYAWSVADASLLTLVQIITDAHFGPLLIGYPFMIASAGMWTKVRMVWFTTACAVLGYLSLTIHYSWWDDPHLPLHRHLVAVILLVVLGFLMSYQVQRVRALSRYYERKDGG